MTAPFMSSDLLKETRKLMKPYEAFDALSITFDAVAAIADNVQDKTQREQLLKSIAEGRKQLKRARAAL